MVSIGGFAPEGQGNHDLYGVLVAPPHALWGISGVTERRSVCSMPVRACRQACWCSVYVGFLPADALTAGRRSCRLTPTDAG